MTRSDIWRTACMFTFCTNIGFAISCFLLPPHIDTAVRDFFMESSAADLGIWLFAAKMIAVTKSTEKEQQP